MGQLGKKIISILAVAMAVFYISSCKKDDTGNNGSNNGENNPDNFAAHYTESILLGYDKIENTLTWGLLMVDKEGYESTAELGHPNKGSSVTFILSSNSNSGFDQGIPVGEYRMGVSNNGEESTATIVITDFATNKTNSYSLGTLKILNNSGEYSFSIDVTDVVGGRFVYSYTIDSNSPLFSLINNAYNSKLTGDLVVNDFTKALIINRKDANGTGQNNWDLLLGTDGVSFNVEGVISGAGQAVQLWLINKENSETIEGTYEIANTFMDNTAEPGTIAEIDGQSTLGSWWLDQTETGQYKNQAPIYSGTVTISINNDKYDVTINAKDDKIPSSNNITIKYNGVAEVFDPSDTGDFYNTAATFYGEFEYKSPNQNWYLSMQDPIYNETNGESGYRIGFDILASPDAVYTKGLPLGTFTVDANATLAVNTIPMAKVFKYTNSEFIEIDLVSGSIKISVLDEFRYVVVVDVMDMDNNKYSGTYTGSIPISNDANPPLTNRVFDGNGAYAGIGYNGTTAFPGKANWFIDLDDKEFIDTNTDGMAIRLDLLLDEDVTFDKGIPSGVYELFPVEDAGTKTGIVNSDHTLYLIYYQTKEFRLAFTSGSIMIENKGGNNYKFTLDLVTGNETVQYTITGGYEGTVEETDISNTRSSTPKRQTKVKGINYKHNISILNELTAN